MTLRFRKTVFPLLPAFAALLVASPALAGWESNVSYGGSMPADFYTPDVPPDSPGVIVSLHYCGGTKGNAQQWFASYANQYGFLIITPQAGGNCFDATPARSGERADIVAMVDYAVSDYGADASRIFAAGASSGACMAHALLAAYPEVFAGGSSLAGVAAGVWTGGNDYAWSVPNRTDEEWGDVVRNINPNYTGPWPRMQIWHGEGDTNLTYSQNYPVEVAQWTNVWGITDGTTESVQPSGATDTWTRTSYVDECGTVGVEANSAGASVPHDLTGRGLWGDVVRFFGLDMPATTPSECTTSTTGTGAGGATSTMTTDTSSTTAAQGGASTDTVSSSGGASSTTDATSGATTGVETATTGTGGAATSDASATGTMSSTVTGTTAAGPATSSVTGGTPTGGTATSGALPPADGAAQDSGSDGGCSCRMPSHGRGVPAGLTFGLVGLFVVVGRRRGRKGSSSRA